jgi:hypothetical protein
LLSFPPFHLKSISKCPSAGSSFPVVQNIDVPLLSRLYSYFVEAKVTYTDFVFKRRTDIPFNQQYTLRHRSRKKKV